jgi:hypothetical protein
MSLLKSTRNAQYPLVAEFQFNFNDTMLDVNGVARDFGSLVGGTTAGAAIAIEPIPLPPNAVVLSGEVVTEVAFDAATYTVTVGDSVSAARYLAATDVKAAARVALVPTGFRSAGENLRVGITVADVCTTGRATVRVEYIISGRAQEVVIK